MYMDGPVNLTDPAPNGIAENGQGPRNSGIDKMRPLCVVSIPALSASNLRLSLDVGRRLSREQDRPGQAAGYLGEGGGSPMRMRELATRSVMLLAVWLLPRQLRPSPRRRCPANRLRRPKSQA
jgi:hypothetical protein